MSLPADTNDFVYYEGKDFYILKNTSVNILPNAVLTITGLVTVNGQPLGTSVQNIVTVGTATYTFISTDANAYVRTTVACSITVPPNSAVAFPVGTRIEGCGTTAAVTFVQGAGVTVIKARTFVTLGAGSGWTIIKVATDTWDLHGDFV